MARWCCKTSKVEPEKEAEKSARGGKCKWIGNSVLVTFLLMMPTVILITLVTIGYRDALYNKNTALAVNEAVHQSLKVSEFISALQVERGYTSLHLSAEGYNHDVYQKVLHHRDLTDVSYLRLTEKSQTKNQADAELDNLLLPLVSVREKVDLNLAHVFETMDTYTNLTTSLIGSLFSGLQGSKQYSLMVAFDSFFMAVDKVGIQRALGGAFWMSCNTSMLDMRFMMAWAETDLLIRTTKAQGPSISAKYEAVKAVHQRLVDSVDNMVETIRLKRFESGCESLTVKTRYQKSLEWFNNVSVYMLGLSGIQRFLTRLLRESTDEIQGEVNYKLSVFSVMLVMTIASSIATIFIVIRVFRMATELEDFAKCLTGKNDELEVEKMRTDELLSMMMPQSVAEQLKKKGSVQAEYYDEVTVFFSDIVGFTNISAASSPQQVVALLNMLYSMFDLTIEQYDVYKVETIGDSYMMASGLPIRNGDRHASEMAALSVDLLKQLEGVSVPHIPSQNVYLRIGLHTGPCAAGVVGIKMPRYCLFGDTINTASRMESTGEAMKVHISQTTKDKLANIPNFITTPRGTIKVKGKGEMPTFWLISNKH